MNATDNSDTTVATLLELRKEADAVRVITERLNVKEMGPADHIRTKHEVKKFVESGEIEAAEDLVRRASERRTVNQRVTVKIAQQHGQRVTQ